MAPAGPGAPCERIQPEFLLHLLVGLFDPAPACGCPCQPSHAEASGQITPKRLARRRRAGGPLHQPPDGLARLLPALPGMRRPHPLREETGPHGSLGSFPPGHPAAARLALLREGFDRLRCLLFRAQTLRSRTRTASAGRARAGRLRPDHPLAGEADDLAYAGLRQPGAQLAATAVVGIGQHDPIRHAPGAGLVAELQG